MRTWRDIAVVITVVLISVATLVWVNDVTAKPRAENEIKEEMRARRYVFPDAVKFVEKELGGDKFYLAYGKDDNLLGVIVPSNTNKGYGGLIALIVGVDPQGNIVRVKVVKSSETPGLGSKATVDGSPFLEQFTGKNLENTRFKVKKDGGDIDAVTSATISSRAITEAIYDALLKFKAHRDELLGGTR